MDQSLSSLTFKGSIAEAILESKNQRKLFVVYISGDDAESSSLERSTWTSSNVAESLSKYCILLHIPAGSVDAVQFSAIYPQKSVPCITAVGYNGIQLWQNEGFVSAEVLASNLEKAWLGLHIQETTASVLTAALASKNSEASTSRPSNSTLSDLGSSSSSTVSRADVFNSSETNPGVIPEMVEEEKGTGQVVEDDAEVVDKGSKVHHAVSFENHESPDFSEENKNSLTAPVDQRNFSIERDSTMYGSSISPKLAESCQSGASRPISSEAKEYALEEKNETINDNKGFINDNSTKDYTSVHLNIRLPNGVNLQEKFSMTSTLRMVKDYVDNNQEITLGSYDLAIPYPRKVFTDHDLDKSLSDLDLSNRQALIVVRRLGVSSDYRGSSSSFDQRNSAANGVSSNQNADGYVAYIKRILSYVNPFSYLGGGVGSASSRQEIQGGMPHNGSNTTAQYDSFEAERPYTRHPSNQTSSMTSGGNSRSRQPSTSRFGANIHTLKHDEDDERFRGRNSFWNGNSTQYGGDDNSK